MQQELLTLHLHDILAQDLNENAIGEDFILGEVDGRTRQIRTQLLDILRAPVRFDAFILFFLKKGRFNIEFNLSSYTVQERSLLVAAPGNIIHVPSLNESDLDDMQLVFAAISRDFIAGLNLDFDKAFRESVRMLANPCITLNDEQYALAESYFLLARQIIRSSQRKKPQIIGGLLSSLSYLTDDVWNQQLDRERARLGYNTTRAKQVYDRFMELVNQYHSSQRSMQFYADQLCLTPKYLSKLIKQASGRSGPQWIDDYVILEAKNMLRYSDAPIKEIVYRLHFPNASVFHKYFKLHTGMTPSQYRNG